VSFLRAIALGLGLLLTAQLQAHPEWREAYCIGVIDDAHDFDFKVKFDVPSYHLGQTPKDASIPALDALMYAPGRLESATASGAESFRNDLHVYADDVEVPVELLAFPTAAEVRELSKKQGEADRYPVLLNARLHAKIPAGTAKVSVAFPTTLGPVIASFRRGMDSQVLMTVAPGQRVELLTGETRTSLHGFIQDGFGHVIPEGWDHCLFMVAMMLAAVSVGEALKRSLIFTLGHAVTLALVVTGALPPVGGWIEPIIAATIALGGFLAYRQKPARTAFLIVPLAFGLIHGLGFAAAAADKLQGATGADLAQLLLGFNLGVEGAQAGLILLTALVLSGLVRAGLDQTKLRRNAGLGIAIAGLAVMFVRLWELVRGA
jgi:hypothetical protein